jgi:DNA-binding GntR family transcriptional regulator
MATPQEIQQEIMDALHDHFDRTGARLTPEKIGEMTALPLDTVRNALRVLHKAGRVEGPPVEEYDDPIEVTGITYE